MADVDGESPGASSSTQDKVSSDWDNNNGNNNKESPAGEASTSKKIVEVACWPCRKRKSKCTGERPACACCIRKRSECTYEHEEGLTRLGSLRCKLSEATDQAGTLQYLFEQLKARSDNQAACILALLRMGVEPEDLVEQLKTYPDELWSPNPEISRLLPRLREFILSQRV